MRVEGKGVVGRQEEASPEKGQLSGGILGLLGRGFSCSPPCCAPSGLSCPYFEPSLAGHSCSNHREPVLACVLGPVLRILQSLTAWSSVWYGRDTRAIRSSVITVFWATV